MKVKLKSIVTVLLTLCFLTGCNSETQNGDFYLAQNQASHSAGSSEIQPAEGVDYGNFDTDSDEAYILEGKSPFTASQNAGSAKPQKVKSISVKKSEADFYKLSGGAYIKNNSGAYLTSECSSVEFKLYASGDITLIFSCSEAYINIYLDGVLSLSRRKINGDNVGVTLNLAKAGNHTVKILRLTGGEALLFTKIKAAGADMQNPAPAKAEKYIEFIGDETLCGLGISLPDSYFSSSDFNDEIAMKPESQNASLAYPYLVGKETDTDITVISSSLSGFATSYFTENSKYLPEKYFEFCETAYQKENPDYIILDAGKTDVIPALLQKSQISSADAVNITADFLKELKNANPKAKIIWCFGLTAKSERLKNHINSVLHLLGGEKNGFYLVEFETTKRKGHYPSEKEHETAAKLLIERIEKIENGSFRK